MKKNMYSLMLTEDVVAEIDREAAKLGTSRSGLVNSILAKYVSYRTPEMRIRDMFDRIEELLYSAGSMTSLLRPSSSMLGMKSMLAYKYNPAVNYGIELYRARRDGAVGEIRASLRTQSAELKYYMTQFYALWSEIEAAYLKRNDCSMSDAKFIKRLRADTDELTEEEICSEIFEYITAFDSALKVFFENLDDPDIAVSEAEKIYSGYYAGCRTAL